MGPSTRENGSINDPRSGLALRNRSRTTTRSDHPLKPIIRGFLKRALLCLLAFGVAHLLGLSAYTSLLSGTASFKLLPHLFGTVYLVLYVGFVFVAPVLLIAAGLLEAFALTSGPWMRAKKQG